MQGEGHLQGRDRVSLSAMLSSLCLCSKQDKKRNEKVNNCQHVLSRCAKLFREEYTSANFGKGVPIYVSILAWRNASMGNYVFMYNCYINHFIANWVADIIRNPDC